MYDLLYFKKNKNGVPYFHQYNLGKKSVFYNETLENTKGQSKNDNLEKLTTSGTQYEIKQSKNTTQCMLARFQPNIIILPVLFDIPA
jgi:hypothetical protein